MISDRFNVHARKTWLQGLSPKENHEVPTLRYEEVYQLKQDFPTLFIEINGGFLEINGGFLTLEQSLNQLDRVDFVMIGRTAYSEFKFFLALYFTSENFLIITSLEIQIVLTLVILRTVNLAGCE